MFRVSCLAPCCSSSSYSQASVYSTQCQGSTSHKVHHFAPSTVGYYQKVNRRTCCRPKHPNLFTVAMETFLVAVVGTRPQHQPYLYRDGPLNMDVIKPPWDIKKSNRIQKITVNRVWTEDEWAEIRLLQMCSHFWDWISAPSDGIIITYTHPEYKLMVNTRWPLTRVIQCRLNCGGHIPKVDCQRLQPLVSVPR